MAKLLSRLWRQTKLLLALLVVCAFIFLMPARFTAPARVLFNEAVGPVETVVYQGAGRTLAASGTLTEMFLAEDRRRALERQLSRLRNSNARLAEELMRWGMRLESIEQLRIRDLSFRAVRAPVSSYDTTALRRSIAVRAGRTDGVGPGMAVTADGALVGVVRETGPSQCRVRMITDPDSVVPCRLSRTRSLCLLVGTGAPTCRLDWVDRDAFVEVGDVIVTRSLEVEPEPGMKLPDGMPAATVKNVQPDRMRPLFRRVDVAPRVNLDRLEEVEILVPSEGAAGPAEPLEGVGR